MKPKVVLTKEGLQFSNELLLNNPNDPPPFIYEGRNIIKNQIKNTSDNFGFKEVKLRN